MALKILLCWCLAVSLAMAAQRAPAKLKPSHRKAHEAIKTWVRQGKRGQMPKGPTGLLRIYYNTAKKLQKTPGKEHRARYYYGILASYEYEIDDVEARIAAIDTIIERNRRLAKHHRWRLTAQFLTYQEEARLKDAGGVENLYSAQRAWCFGGQYAYGNLEQEWTVDACAFSGRGNVGADNAARYFQQDVSSQGLLLKPAWWKVLSDGEAAVGLGLPMMWRQVDYTEPTGATVVNRSSFPVGLSMEGRWMFTPRWGFTSSAGWFGQSLLWSLGASYGL
jgi:hypothetical protein